MVVPFLWMVSTSFKLPADQFTKTLIPPTFTLDNFRELFSVDLNFPLLFWNSAYISALHHSGSDTHLCDGSLLLRSCQIQGA